MRDAKHVVSYGQIAVPLPAASPGLVAADVLHGLHRRVDRLGPLVACPPARRRRLAV